MLLFYCAEAEGLDAVRRDGLRDDTGNGLALHETLEAAEAACTAAILVIDPTALPKRPQRIPPAAIANLDPYLAPLPVTAAGGYVVRPGDDEPEVLLIFRRGVWDLPKGKQDPGETVEACALREVREEVGIGTLYLGQPVGTTVHGYERDGRYHVKTTHWFLMQTPETRFTPEAREGIEAVAWVPWREAVRRIPYPTFRAHMQRIEETVRAALRSAQG